MGLGPQLTGIASDLLNKYTLLGTDSLRWALLAVLSANIFSGVLYLYSARFLRDDLALPKDI